ncbi:MAG: helix-turn-helix transcriptional regulator [Lentisphaeria bacterium]|nr:helix-turn-helix transcriptional regulator [Lentisphaeria bacterium]
MTRIKEFRARRKMKAADLARLLQISRAAVCYIERCGIKHADTAMRYAAVLHCRPEELMDFTPRTCAGKQ